MMLWVPERESLKAINCKVDAITLASTFAFDATAFIDPKICS